MAIWEIKTPIIGKVQLQKTVTMLPRPQARADSPTMPSSMRRRKANQDINDMTNLNATMVTASKLSGPSTSFRLRSRDLSGLEGKTPFSDSMSTYVIT
jgi:hypothetical protein